MAGYKETPRQKMIGMMYLVLTALLALNVSKDILEAFLIVNESMDSTNETFKNKIENTYNQFEFQYNLNKNKVGPYWEKAMEARVLANTFINDIERIKFEIVQSSEHMEEDSIGVVQEFFDVIEVQDPNNPDLTINKLKLKLESVPTKDKYDQTTNYFINRGKASILKDQIEEYKINILALVDSAYRDQIKIGMETEGEYFDAGGKRESWEMHNFYATILAADITILNKLIAEIQIAEFDVVNLLFDEISITDFKFDEVDAKVIPKTSYILKGQDYEAEVLVAAYDTKQNPEVFILRGADQITAANINRAEKIDGEDGVVNLKWGSTTEGMHKYAGLIKIKDPQGEEVTYPFSHEYIVAPPSLTVAATKMNVFYIGVQNPVSISVPGIANELIRPSISTGSIKSDPESPGNWLVEVPTGARRATISAVATYQGQTMDMGSAEFRVKRVPDPVAEIAGMIQGKIEKNTLLAANAIIPELKDFEFELYFVVTSYKVITIIGGDLVQKNVRGNRFNNEVINIIRNARRDQRFSFENIQATSEDGTTRVLNPINLEIK